MVFNLTLDYPGQEQKKSPRPFHSISVKYDYSDPDSDSEMGTSYIWELFEDGTWTLLSRDLVLNPVFTSKGNAIRCTVIPNDGEDDGLQIVSDVITIGNTVPTVPFIQIDIVAVQNQGNFKSDLRLNYTYFDADGDSEVDTTVNWYRDGELQVKFNNKLVIHSKNTSKHEIWTVEVTPHDGEEFGSSVQSSPYTIPNIPPLITKLTILPSSPSALNDLEVEFEYIDEDEDKITAIDLRWFKDANRMQNLDNKSSISGDELKKGDVWTCEVRIFDGETWSSWVKSEPAIIQNAPPVVATNPSSYQIQMNELEEQTFSASATDVDDDVLLYYWYLDDQIESLTSSYSFSTDYDSGGYHKLNLSIFDGEAWTTKTWDIMVLNVNRKPWLQVKAPQSKDFNMNEMETVEFIITTGDPDEDVLKIQWYLDKVPIGTSGEEYIYQPDTTASGDHVISVVVSDTGLLNASAAWNVTVKDIETGKDEKEGMFGMSWDEIGIIIEVIVVIFTAIFAAVGIIKVRKKQGKLKEYMAKIEKIKKQKIMPDKTEKKLSKLKKDIKTEFSKGLISENHYIILERELDDALGDTRREIIKSDIAPPDIIATDVEKALEDGMITRAEYKTLMAKIMKDQKLTGLKKKQLKSHMKRWLEEDEGLDKEVDESVDLEEDEDENLDNDIDG
jgi:hypothetical protein